MFYHPQLICWTFPGCSVLKLFVHVMPIVFLWFSSTNVFLCVVFFSCFVCGFSWLLLDWLFFWWWCRLPLLRFSFGSFFMLFCSCAWRMQFCLLATCSLVMSLFVLTVLFLVCLFVCIFLCLCLRVCCRSVWMCLLIPAEIHFLRCIQYTLGSGSVVRQPIPEAIAIPRWAGDCRCRAPNGSEQAQVIGHVLWITTGWWFHICSIFNHTWPGDDYLHNWIYYFGV